MTRALIVNHPRAALSVYHRQTTVFRYLENNNQAEYRLVDYFVTLADFEKDIAPSIADFNYEFIIFTRDFPIAELPEKVKAYFHNKGVKIVLDLDEPWRGPNNTMYMSDAATVLEYANNSDRIIVGNRKLGDLIGPPGARCSYIPTVIEQEFTPKDMRKQKVVAMVSACPLVSDFSTLVNIYPSYKLEPFPKVKFGFYGYTKEDYCAVAANAIEAAMSANLFEVSDYAKSLLMDKNVFASAQDPVWRHIESRLYEEPYIRIWKQAPELHLQGYQKIDIALFPIREELSYQGMSVTRLIECNATRTNFIAANYNSYREFFLLFKIKNGLTRANGKIIDWCKAINTLLTNEDFKAEQSGRLKEACDKYFTMEQWSQKKMDTLQKTTING